MVEIKLNKGQIEILELLYKYRFGTRKLLGSSLGINSGTSLFERLEVLEKQEYIGKRIDIRSGGLNKPIAYFVAPKGLKALQSLPDHEYIDDRAVRLSYQNKSTLHDGYIAHILNIFTYALC